MPFCPLLLNVVCCFYLHCSPPFDCLVNVVTSENDLHFPHTPSILFWVRDGQKKDLRWIKKVGGAGWLLFSECLPPINAQWADGCWDVQVPASPRSSLDFLSRCHTHWSDVNYVLNDIFRGQAAPRCLLPQIGFTGSLLLVRIHCSCYVSSTHQGFRQTGEWYFLWPFVINNNSLFFLSIIFHKVSMLPYFMFLNTPSPQRLLDTRLLLFSDLCG